jgi:hypothetical protein
MSKPLSPGRIWLARAVALAADALQIGLLPLFIGGATEGADAVLDALVAVLLTLICGFHFAFLPTLVAEALPGIDIFPSWTLATLFVTRQAATLPATGRTPAK